MKKLFVLFMFIVCTSCTDNNRARHFGGTETVKLFPKEKFINITWKETSLWVITQDTTTGVFYAREKSSYGLLEGKIIITK